MRQRGWLAVIARRFQDRGSGWGRKEGGVGFSLENCEGRNSSDAKTRVPRRVISIFRVGLADPGNGRPRNQSPVVASEASGAIKCLMLLTNCSNSSGLAKALSAPAVKASRAIP